MADKTGDARRGALVKWIATRPRLATFFLLIGISACGAEAEPKAGSYPVTPPPVDFVAGSYELIGRYPDSDNVYSGTMTIGVADENSGSLTITRRVGGKTIPGSGVVTSTTGDAVVVLRIEFEGAHGAEMEATYLIDTDLDNYARLTGYVYAKNGDTTIPGIEALFSDHYRQ